MPPSRRRLLAAGVSVLVAGCSALTDTQPGDGGSTDTEAPRTRGDGPLPTATPGEAWTSHRHDAANTGYAPVTGPAAPELDWRRDLVVRATPVGDTILVGGTGSVRALDAADGTARWRTDVARDAEIRHPVVTGDRVVALAADGTLAVLDAGDGTVAWSVASEEAAFGAPTVVENLVLVAGETTVRAYDLADGAQQWRYGPVEWTYATVSAVGVRDRDCYVTVGGREPTLRRLTTGGDERWRHPVPELSTPPVVGPENVYVAEGGDELPVGLYAVDRATGERAWTGDVGGRRPPAVADGRVFWNPAGGETVALDAATGEQVWSVGGAGLHGRNVAVDATRVYGPGDEERVVRALSRTDGERAWSVDVGFEVEQFAVTDDAVYASGGGWLARLTDP